MLFTQHYLDEAWFLKAYILNRVRNTKHVCCFVELLGILVFFWQHLLWGNRSIWLCFTDVPRMRKPGDNCYIEVSRAGMFFWYYVYLFMGGATVLIPVICSWIWINYHVGRARSSVSNWEGRDQPPSHEEPTTSSSTLAPTGHPYSSVCPRQSYKHFICSVTSSFSLIFWRL